MRGSYGIIGLLLLGSAAGCRDASTAGPGEPPLPEFECGVAADCADLAIDAGPCHVASCLAGSRTCALVAVADETPCDDADACTDDERCVAGGCTPTGARTCDDQNGCTDDSCDPQRGCQFEANNGGCDDGNGCTEADVCSGGACVGGTNICPCTTTPDCGTYEDGDLCNGTLVCNTATAPSVCEVDTPTVVQCDPSANTACQSNLCAPANGSCSLVAAADGSPCSDGEICTDTDICANGLCAAGGSVTCDDGTPCTDESCLASVGCVYIGNGSCSSCAGLDCLGCAYGTDCAQSGAPIGSTCCASGDTLTHIGNGYGAEVVDLEVDDTYAYLCGGFGVRISRITAPTAPAYISASSSTAQRCQRIGIGARLSNGIRSCSIK